MLFICAFCVVRHTSQHMDVGFLALDHLINKIKPKIRCIILVIY